MSNGDTTPQLNPPASPPPPAPPATTTPTPPQITVDSNADNLTRLMQGLNQGGMVVTDGTHRAFVHHSQVNQFLSDNPDWEKGTIISGPNNQLFGVAKASQIGQFLKDNPGYYAGLPRQQPSAPTAGEQAQGVWATLGAIPGLQAAQKYYVDPLNRWLQTASQYGARTAERAVAGFVEPSPPQVGKTPATEEQKQQAVQQLEQDYPATAGMAQGAGALVTGTVADPRMWPMMFAPGALPVVQRLASAGFSAQMLYGAYKNYPEIKAAADRGDVQGTARGLTDLVGQVGFGTLGAMHAIEPVAGAAWNAAEPLRQWGSEQFQRSAEAQEQRVLTQGGGTRKEKAIAAKIAPQMAERGVIAGSRAGLEEQAGAKAQAAGQQIDDFYQNLPAGTTIPTQPLLDYFEQAKGQFIAPDSGAILDQGAIDRVDALKQVIQQFGPDVSVDDLVKTRRLWDNQVAASGPGHLLPAEESTALEIKRDATNAIRGELARRFPDLDRINKEFSFWQGMNQVMSATNMRKGGHAWLSLQDLLLGGGGLTGGLAHGGGMGEVATLSSAAIGLSKALKSTAWNTVSAAIKYRIADMLVDGNLIGAARAARQATGMGVAGPVAGPLLTPQEQLARQSRQLAGAQQQGIPFPEGPLFQMQQTPAPQRTGPFEMPASTAGVEEQRALPPGPEQLQLPGGPPATGRPAQLPAPGETAPARPGPTGPFELRPSPLGPQRPALGPATLESSYPGENPAVTITNAPSAAAEQARRIQLLQQGRGIGTAAERAPAAAPTLPEPTPGREPLTSAAMTPAEQAKALDTWKAAQNATSRLDEGPPDRAAAIHVNEDAYRLFQNMGRGGWKGINFQGEDAAQMAQAFRNYADNLEQAGDPSPAPANLRQLADHINRVDVLNNDPAGHAGVPFVRERYPEVMQHEAIVHGGQRILAGGEGDIRNYTDVERTLSDPKDLADGVPVGISGPHPAYEKAYPALQAMGATQHPAVAAAEMEAHILDGNHERLGLTRQDAVSFIQHSLDVLAQHHGPDVMENLPQLAQRYVQALQDYVRTGGESAVRTIPETAAEAAHPEGAAGANAPNAPPLQTAEGAAGRGGGEAYSPGLAAPEEVSPSRLPLQSSVKLMGKPLPVEGTGPGGRVKVADVGKALEEYSRKVEGPPIRATQETRQEAIDRYVKAALPEVKYQLAQEKTGLDWYKNDIRDTQKTFAQNGYPELDPDTGDPTKQTLFRAMVAGASLGNKEIPTIRNARGMWDEYQRTGKVPIVNPATGKGWQNGQFNAYQHGFRALQQLIDDKGEAGAAQFLMSEHPVSELRQYRANTPGKAADQRYGGLIFGDKMGPFFLNMSGIHSELTADMWEARAWNRIMGTLDDPKSESGLIDAPRNETERSIMKDAKNVLAQKLNLDTASAQAVSWFYEQNLYNVHGIERELASYADAAKQHFADVPGTNVGKGPGTPTSGQTPVTEGVPAGNERSRGRSSTQSAAPAAKVTPPALTMPPQIRRIMKPTVAKK